MRVDVVSAQDVVVSELDDCTRLSVSPGPFSAEQAGSTLIRLGFASSFTDESAWLRIDRLRAQGAARPTTAGGWTDRFDAMIAYAVSKGWTDGPQRSVRAHFEGR